ncbi:MAG: winged helix-turn-helix transcriptional regulator [bacterium]|nr:winged helix-turn-helix transcriptional regulator [bacterium]
MTAEFSQNVTIDALTMLFASSARAKVLRLFMLDPLRAYYQRQIEGATGLAIRSVQRELERLTELGLLYRHAEGNRTYYQVDVHFPLFSELREMVLKTADPHDRLRGLVAMDDAVRLAFFCEEDNRVLIVTAGDRRPAMASPVPYAVDIMTSEEFVQALAQDAPTLEPYLKRGADLLGRREDVIWRRIEAAGHSVGKGKGVA